MSPSSPNAPLGRRPIREEPASRQTRSARWPMLAVGALALFFWTSQAWAYTIYLKDGSKIQARQQYQVQGDKALIVLLNGTSVSYDASQIDVQRTEKANQTDFGSAVLLEGGKERQLARKPAPPRQKTLSDLINQNKAGIRAPQTSRKPDSQEAGVNSVPKTPAGFDDLAALHPESFPGEAVSIELKQYFLAQGVEPDVHLGTDPTYPLVRVKTNSEASVFRALAIAVTALQEIQPNHSENFQGIDLVLTNAASQRAGQFQITPAMATELISKQTDVQSFFVKYVQF